MTTRNRLAVITLVLLAGALALRLFGGEEQGAIEFACLRMAIVLGAAWMAYPQMATLPRWLVLATGAVALVAAIKPKALIVGLPILGALWMLRPRHRPPRV
jgi:hypothetical protein